MVTRDPRVDAYIAKAPVFARPVLTHLRKVVHAGCPQVIETMKWSRPAFEHRGILGGMAAFKAHCVFGFWKHEAVLGTPERGGAAGSFGRIESVEDLPSKVELTRLVKKAAKLNEAEEKGTPRPRPMRRPRPEIPMHPALAKALAQNARARATFEGFAPSHRREYLEWITEAKADATRERRIAQTLEWLAEGKSRHWKYQQR